MLCIWIAIYFPKQYISRTSLLNFGQCFCTCLTFLFHYKGFLIHFRNIYIRATPNTNFLRYIPRGGLIPAFCYNYTTGTMFDVDHRVLFRGQNSLDRSSVFIIVPLVTVMGCPAPPSLLGARRPVPRDKAFVTLTRHWTAREDSINALIFMSSCTKPRVVYLSIGQRLGTWTLCGFINAREV